MSNIGRLVACFGAVVVLLLAAVGHVEADWLDSPGIWPLSTPSLLLVNFQEWPVWFQAGAEGVQNSFALEPWSCTVLKNPMAYSVKRSWWDILTFKVLYSYTLQAVGQESPPSFPGKQNCFDPISCAGPNVPGQSFWQTPIYYSVEGFSVTSYVGVSTTSTQGPRSWWYPSDLSSTAWMNFAVAPDSSSPPWQLYSLSDLNGRPLVYAYSETAPPVSWQTLLSWSNCTSIANTGSNTNICTGCEPYSAEADAIPETLTPSASSTVSTSTIPPAITATPVESGAPAPAPTLTPPYPIYSNAITSGDGTEVNDPAVSDNGESTSMGGTSSAFEGLAIAALLAAVAPEIAAEIAVEDAVDLVFQALGLSIEEDAPGAMNNQILDLTQIVVNQIAAVSGGSNEDLVLWTQTDAYFLSGAPSIDKLQAQMDSNLAAIETQLSDQAFSIAQTTMQPAIDALIYHRGVFNGKLQLNYTQRTTQVGCPWTPGTSAYAAWHGDLGFQSLVFVLSTLDSVLRQPGASTPYFQLAFNKLSSDFVGSAANLDPAYVAQQMESVFEYYKGLQTQATYILSSYASFCGAYDASALIIQYNLNNILQQKMLYLQWTPHALLTLAKYNYTAGNLQLGMSAGINSKYYCLTDQNIGWRAGTGTNTAIWPSSSGETCPTASNPTNFFIVPAVASEDTPCFGCVLANRAFTTATSPDPVQRIGLALPVMPTVPGNIAGASFSFFIGGTFSSSWIMAPTSATTYNVLPFDGESYLSGGVIGTKAVPATWYTNLTSGTVLAGNWDGGTFTFVEELSSVCAEAWDLGTVASGNHCDAFCGNDNSGRWGGNFSLPANVQIGNCSHFAKSNPASSIGYAPRSVITQSYCAQVPGSTKSSFQGAGFCLHCPGTSGGAVLITNGTCEDPEATAICLLLPVLPPNSSPCGNCACNSQPVPGSYFAGPPDPPTAPPSRSVKRETTSENVKAGKSVTKHRYINVDAQLTIENMFSGYVDIYAQSKHKTKFKVRIPPKKHVKIAVLADALIRARETSTGRLLTSYLTGTNKTQKIEVVDNTCKKGALSYSTPGGCCCAPDTVIRKTVTGRKVIIVTKAKAAPGAIKKTNISKRVTSVKSAAKATVKAAMKRKLKRRSELEEAKTEDASLMSEHHLEARHLCSSCPVPEQGGARLNPRFCCPKRKRITSYSTKWITKTKVVAAATRKPGSG